jgi:DNA-binding SARP family transcriptional activator
VEFDLLGTLRVRAAGGGAIDLGPPKPRALLAVLLTRAGEVVPRTTLYESVWPSKRPLNPRNALQINAHRLRMALDDQARITCCAGGYQLSVRPGEVDWHRFRDLVSRSRSLRDAGRPKAAIDLLRRALSLWRGTPFGEFDDVYLLRTESQAMTEQWITAHEELAELELVLGGHAGVVPRMRALTAEHPYRERAHELLMHALIRSGCPGEALRQYHALSERLAVDLGTDPSFRLRRLHHRVLVEDPTLIAG